MKDNDTQNIFEAYTAVNRGTSDTKVVTLYGGRDYEGEPVEAEVEYSVVDDSFSHEFGTEDFGPYIVVSRVIVDGRALSDKELRATYDTTRDEIAEELEIELEDQL
jgi:hypothetical protein